MVLGRRTFLASDRYNATRSLRDRNANAQEFSPNRSRNIEELAISSLAEEEWGKAGEKCQQVSTVF